MKNFNELFETASQVGDHRLKIFNQLIENTKTEILPRFCESMKKLGYTKFNFDTSEAILVGMEEKPDFKYENGFPFSVNSDFTISVNYYEYEGGGTVFKECYKQDIDTAAFTKTGIINFRYRINKRLEKIISEREAENEEAENVLKRKMY